MDLGHQLTDEELAKLERKIAKVYKTAADEMQDKITEYFKKFDEQDKKKRALLEQGKITEQEYKQWRLGKLATGKKYQSMRNQLAERMTNANQEAVAYVNSSTPTVYSLNRNYTAYQIEQADINASFQLWDENTVARLIKDNPELMPNYPKEKALARGIDLDWGKKQISKEITTGILLGESNQRIAKRLLTELPDMNKASAIRTARTATTSAENGGRLDTFKQAEQMGIPIKKQWRATHDGRTREEHILADGQIVGVDEPFIVGGEELMKPGDDSGSGWNIYNCFSGDIKVASDSKAIRSYKHKYKGDLVRIKTATGIEFSCTPNHPILTPNGWVSANMFNNGDDILIASIGGNMLFGRNPDVEHIFPSFSAFHKSIKMFRGQRTIALGVNFHGDVATTDVEIIAQKRFLTNNGDTSRFKRLRELIFKHTYIALTRKSALMEHFGRICKSSFGLISLKRVLLSFIRSHICHSDIHRFRTPTNMNISLTEYPIDNIPAETEIRSELLNGLTAKVFVDKVVSVKIISSNCHVYNLQTENGYYFVNSIIPQNSSKVNGNFVIAKNCRCGMYSIVKGRVLYNPDTDANYQKWLEAKQQSKEQKTNVKWEYVEKQEQASMPQFTPAKTIDEAQQYAERFVTDFKTKFSGKIDYKGIELDYANEMNRALTEVFGTFKPTDKLNNLTPFNTREARFKNTTAEAAYQWGTGDMFFNKAYYKTKKVFQAHQKEAEDLLNTILPDVDILIDKYKGQTGGLASKQLRYIEALKTTKRSNVYAPDAYGSMVHELGHFLDDTTLRKAMKETSFSLSDSFSKFSGKISAYATSSEQEYVAESFAAYWKGEKDILDPALVKLFERLKK